MSLEVFYAWRGVITFTGSCTPVSGALAFTAFRFGDLFGGEVVCKKKKRELVAVWGLAVQCSCTCTVKKCLWRNWAYNSDLVI